MKIDPSLTRVGTEVSADRVARQRADAAQTRSAHAPAQELRTDAAILSAEAQDVMFAQRMLAKTSEVREDKVAELRQRIAEGSFEVDAELVADKLAEGGL